MERIGIRKIENLQPAAWKWSLEDMLKTLIPVGTVIGLSVGTIFGSLALLAWGGLGTGWWNLPAGFHLFGAPPGWIW